MYLNLGCGQRFHPDWTNIDLNSLSPCVRAYDLRKGIPCPDNMFALVYHSHLLEHLPKPKALDFMRECYRVLKPGGIIRVVVPDLERIARLYLEALEKASRGEGEWKYHYEWMVLELYDQAAREQPGGAMLQYLKRDPIPNEAFVYERLGDEARRIVQDCRIRSCSIVEEQSSIHGLAHRARLASSFVRRMLVKALLGADDYHALQIGRVRLMGEVHQWMYDHYSLGMLLRQAGFQALVRRSACESAIAGWERSGLDTQPDGSVYKPDSLYMEAVKPDA